MPEALAQRIAGNERLQLGHHLVVPAECEVSLEPLLDRAQPHLLQPRDLRLRELLVRQVRQRCPAPERKRIAQLRGRALGGGTARLGHELLEAGEVQLGRIDVQNVARRASHEPVVPDRLSQPGDVDLNGLGGRERRRGAPQRIDQTIGRHHLVRVQQQHGQDRTLLRAAQGERALVPRHLKRAENAEVHALQVVAEVERGVRVLGARLREEAGVHAVEGLCVAVVGALHGGAALR